MLFGLSRQRRPARFGLNAGVASFPSSISLAFYAVFFIFICIYENFCVILRRKIKSLALTALKSKDILTSITIISRLPKLRNLS